MGHLEALNKFPGDFRAKLGVTGQKKSRFLLSFLRIWSHLETFIFCAVLEIKPVQMPRGPSNFAPGFRGLKLNSTNSAGKYKKQFTGPI